MLDSSTAPRSTMRDAINLIDAGACVWCEGAPAVAESYLCRDCSQSDPGGVLAKPQHRVAAAQARNGGD